MLVFLSNVETMNYTNALVSVEIVINPIMLTSYS